MMEVPKEGKVRFIGVVEVAGELSNIVISTEFSKGLEKLDDFSHVIILYWFHLRDNEKNRHTIQVIPRRHPGAPKVGVFASRSPSRPNPIGLCVTELVKIEGRTLILRGLDAFEGTPIVDIKPYLSRADSVPNTRSPEWASRGPKS